MPELVVSSSEDSEVVVSGELDAHSSAALLAAIDAAGRDVRVDLSQCSFIDSSGLSAILTAHVDREQGDGSLTIVSPSPLVQRLFDICGVSTKLTIEPGTDSAGR